MGFVVTLVLLGFILLIFEIFLPGMIAGCLGAGCLVAAIVAGYVNFATPFNHLNAMGILFGGIIGFILWIRFFPGSRLGRRFASEQVIGDLGNERSDLIGAIGTALTDLRPSGTALIAGNRVDVVSGGDYLLKGQDVKVVDVEGLRVVVKALSPRSAPLESSAPND